MAKADCKATVTVMICQLKETIKKFNFAAQVLGWDKWYIQHCKHEFGFFLFFFFVFYRWKVSVPRTTTFCQETHPGIKVFFKTLRFIIFCLTSAPFCLAEQWLMLSVPDIKSFWTSTTRNTLTGRTIWKRISNLHSSTSGDTFLLLWD